MRSNRWRSSTAEQISQRGLECSPAGSTTALRRSRHADLTSSRARVTSSSRTRSSATLKPTEKTPGRRMRQAAARLHGAPEVRAGGRGLITCVRVSCAHRAQAGDVSLALGRGCRSAAARLRLHTLVGGAALRRWHLSASAVWSGHLSALLSRPVRLGWSCCAMPAAGRRSRP